ncbi:hypothetical protein Pint_26598 [Pistacia integerrima]|uniref:Uncharacterized protein n=1 Tax=Pistacia integerrima TaxID=434235 RepID=A0ACC0YQT4_9ROSI|nr:hypothetical protein Pint_26598 [Pistacia integerrima]
MEITKCVSTSGKKKHQYYINIVVDIVHDIFLRLPAKSLLRFRCVSKKCCDIIDSVSFANMYELVCVEEPQILYTPLTLNLVKKLHSIAYDETNYVMKKSETSILEFSEEKHDYQLCHVAYGLLCIRDGGCHQQPESVFLFNPLTREVLELPKAIDEVWKNTYKMWRPVWYGMGFDYTTNTIKVVRVFHRHQYETEVYTLGTNSWRRISSNPSCTLNLCGVTAYGDMHWMHHSYLNDKQYEKMITSFDFKKEEFKWTRHPNLEYNAFAPYKRISLITIKGSLAIVNILSYTQMEIWVLKDYDDKEDYYWVREFKLCIKSIRLEDSWQGFWCLPEVFGAWGYGGLFLDTCHHEHYVIDMKKNHTHHISQCILEEDYNCDERAVYSYTKSLVCLRNFGNSVENHGYKFLKRVRNVYVSPN